MAQNAPSWTTFAWRGFHMEVPVNWELGAFDGDDDIGYLRLDDLYIPRLEIRWKRARAGTNIDRAAKTYLDNLQMTYKRRKLSPIPQPSPLDLALPNSQDLQVRGYRWKGQAPGVAAVILCHTCRRISVVQMFFPPEGFSAKTYKRVFASLHDHNPPDQAHWDFYLLHLRTPDDWRLAGHKFNPGYAELNFVSREKFQADFRRWGPASVLLENNDLQAWAKQNWPTGLHPDNVNNITHQGESAVLARRTGSGLLAPFRRTFGRGPGVRKALYWQSTAWHCVKSDRLWMVDIFARSEPQAEQPDYQVLCHQLLPPELSAAVARS